MHTFIMFSLKIRVVNQLVTYLRTSG